MKNETKCECKGNCACHHPTDCECKNQCFFDGCDCECHKPQEVKEEGDGVAHKPFCSPSCVPSIGCAVKESEVKEEVKWIQKDPIIKESDWESRFDKKFGRLVMAQETDTFGEEPYGVDDIKDFIRQEKALSKQEERQRLVKEVEKLKEEQKCSPMHVKVKHYSSLEICHQCSAIGGSNLAINKVINLLNKE